MSGNKKCNKSNDFPNIGFTANPFLAIQNISQPVDSNGTDTIFNIGVKTKYAKLSLDGKKVIIRKKNDYIISADGALLSVASLLNKVTFILLLNGVPVNETISQSVVPGTGANIFENFKINLKLKRHDTLELYIESSEATNTYVPNLVVGGNPVVGKGITLSVSPVAANEGIVVEKAKDINSTSVKGYYDNNNNSGHILYFSLSEPYNNTLWGTPMEITGNDEMMNSVTAYFQKYGNNIRVYAYAYENRNPAYLTNILLWVPLLIPDVGEEPMLLISVAGGTYIYNDPEYNVPV